MRSNLLIVTRHLSAGANLCNMVYRTRRGFLTSTVSGSFVVIAGCAGDRSETTPTSEQTLPLRKLMGATRGMNLKLLTTRLRKFGLLLLTSLRWSSQYM